MHDYYGLLKILVVDQSQVWLARVRVSRSEWIERRAGPPVAVGVLHRSGTFECRSAVSRTPDGPSHRLSWTWQSMEGALNARWARDRQRLSEAFDCAAKSSGRCRATKCLNRGTTHSADCSGARPVSGVKGHVWGRRRRAVPMKNSAAQYGRLRSASWLSPCKDRTCDNVKVSDAHPVQRRSGNADKIRTNE